MKTVDKVLAEQGIKPPPGKLSDDFYTTCPHCSAGRSPAHREANCLHVKVTKDGVVWFCNHCPWRGGETFKANGRDRGREEFIAVYYYPDDDGVVKARKVRPRSGKPKCFWQHLDHRGEWVKTKGAAPRLLYRLPELREALANEHPVLIVEGEKDVDSAYRIGLPATCNPDGATGQKWRRADSEVLRGADIVIVPDHDEEGYKHANLIAQTSRGIAKRVRVLTLAKHWPECPKGGDISDFLAAGNTGEELAKHIEAAPDYVPPEGAKKEASPASNGDGIDDAAALERLARLGPLEYERARKDAGKRLGISRLSLLDALVKAKRAELGLDGDDGKSGHAIEFPGIEPWPEPVGGAELLDEIAKAMGAHVIMAEHSRDACALWAAHTFLLDCTMISPRLAFTSPTKGCGKTTALDVMGQLVSRPLAAANVSPSAIFRVVEACHPTLLIDEADSFLKDNEELRGVLNSGHRKGGQILRTVAVGDDFEVRSFATYGAIAIALIGQLPGTLADRSVPIALTRRKQSEPVTPFRLDRVEHLVTLARQLARWTKDNQEGIAAVEPEMPTGLYNRAADNWRPLLAIATVAGGDWLARGHKAALAGAGADVDEVSRLELLLGDFRDTIFPEVGLDEISSAKVIEKLVEITPRPWAEYGKGGRPITQNKLARLLKPLGITPQQIRVGVNADGKEIQVRGYRKVDFKEAFERFLAEDGSSNRHTVTNPDNAGISRDSKPSQADPSVTVRKCEKSNNDGVCDTVTLRKGGKGKERDTRTYLTFLGTEPFAPCAHCGKTGGVVHHVRDNRNLARPSVPLHEDCVADCFAAAEPAPPAGDGSMGLSVRTIRKLAGEYQERLYSQYQGHGSTDVDSRPLDAWLRQRLAALGVFREHIDAELARVMDVVFAI